MMCNYRGLIVIGWLKRQMSGRLLIVMRLRLSIIVGVVGMLNYQQRILLSVDGRLGGRGHGRAHAVRAAIQAVVVVSRRSRIVRSCAWVGGG